MDGNVNHVNHAINNKLKDTRRKKSPSNKTSTLLESMNMYMCVIVTSSQLFIEGS